MNFKLALKNVKKSIKNYAVYFLTLSFAVCIFYAFNSVGAQGKLLATSGDKEIITMMGEVIGYISVFVSIVLGCLIIYANNFLIKRRKKELGLYMSLGMQKGKISKMLVLEELIIGVVSLICGIISGVIISQFLALLTVKLFNASNTSFSVVFSLDAMIKSIVYFGIIFILVMIFNVVIVSKYKLIDLLTAYKKNEKIKMKNPIVAGAIFIISLILIGVAYKLVLKAGFNPQDTKFKVSILLGVVGTLLFFYGLTGFVVLILSKIKGIYYKKLNVFTVRQMSSKINTNFISMAVISLMLFITISLIAASVGFKTQNIGAYTPFSATIQTMGDINSGNVEKVLNENGFKLPEGSTENTLNIMNIKDVTLGEVLPSYVDKSSVSYKEYWNQPAQFISLSQYNKNLELMGKEKVALPNNEVLLLSNSQFVQKVVDSLYKGNKEINISGKEYKVEGSTPITQAITTDHGPVNSFIFVVNDDVVKNAQMEAQYLNINYGKDTSGAESYINNYFGKNGVKKLKVNDKDDLFTILQTKIGVEQGQSQMTTMILYIGLYIGAIFLVASAAVLALQQLSEASDSYDRYVALRKIGANKKQINRSIFVQTLIYFGLPLALGLAHAIVGICVANSFIASFGKSSILKASVMTMGVIIFIYFGYFLVTYLGYKNIVKEK